MTGIVKCRACGAEIFFIKTPAGKSMPLNAEPVDFVPDLNGPEKYVTAEGAVVRGCVPQGGEPDIHRGWIAHWATCSNSDYFRKPRKSDRRDRR